MGFKMAMVVVLAASLPAFAGTSSAKETLQGNPARNPQKQQSGSAEGSGARRMGPGMRGMVTGAQMRLTMRRRGQMNRMGPMVFRARRIGPMGWVGGGPLRVFARLQAALDNPRIRTRLKLTDQQANSLRKILVGTETYAVTHGAAVLADAIEERELLRADKPDKTAVMAKGAAISKSVSLLIDHALDAILAAKAILTPAQQEMIREYLTGGARMPLRAPHP